MAANGVPASKASALSGGASAAALSAALNPGAAASAQGGIAAAAAAVPPAALPAAVNPAQARIDALDQRRRELTAQRKGVIKDMKNERRKEQRLVSKTRGISDDALLQIVANRAIAKAASPKAKSKAVAKAKAANQG